jgi:hypothetical protein
VGQVAAGKVPGGCRGGGERWVGAIGCGGRNGCAGWVVSAMSPAAGRERERLSGAAGEEGGDKAWPRGGAGRGLWQDLRELDRERCLQISGLQEPRRLQAKDHVQCARQLPGSFRAALWAFRMWPGIKRGP